MSRCLTVMVTPGITAPVVSLAAPWMAPVVTWAEIEKGTVMTTKINKEKGAVPDNQIWSYPGAPAQEPPQPLSTRSSDGAFCCRHDGQNGSRPVWREPQDQRLSIFSACARIIGCELEVDSRTLFGGEIEVEESYFGGQRKGNRGRGAAGKIPVFGLLKRGGKVYTKIIPDASAATLLPIIERKVVPDSVVYSDSWNGYNVLDVADFHHVRINHSEFRGSQPYQRH